MATSGSVAIRAVANPYRQEILRLVWDRELSSGEIARRFDVRWPSISRNLKILREAGLVDERRAGTQRFYRANRQVLQPLEALLRQMWEANLDRLAVLAEEREQEAPGT